MKFRGSVRHQCGFTLIELLLASLLFSIIALSIYLVFSQGLRVEKRLRHGSAVDRDAFWAMKRIERDLKNIEPCSFSLYGSNESRQQEQTYRVDVNREALSRASIDLGGESSITSKFKGEKNSFSFLAAGESGLYEVYYWIREPEKIQIHRINVNREGGNRARINIGRETTTTQYELVRIEKFFLEQEDKSEDQEEKVLVSNISEDGLVFSYLSIDKEGNKTWASEWHEKKLPAVVRIDLTVNGEDGGSSRIIRDVFLLAHKEEAGV